MQRERLGKNKRELRATLKVRQEVGVVRAFTLTSPEIWSKLSLLSTQIHSTTNNNNNQGFLFTVDNTPFSKTKSNQSQCSAEVSNTTQRLQHFNFSYFISPH